MELRKALDKFSADPDGLQKLVGLTVGAVAFLVDFFNILTILKDPGHSFLDAILDWYTIAITMIGVFGVVSGFWKSAIAKWLQISLFFITTILAAITSAQGDLTSAIFLIFGLVLISQYNLGRCAIWVGCLFSLVAYPLALAKGIGRISSSFVSQLASAIAMVICLIGLYGSVLLKHELRHRQDKDLLETRVKERTADLERALTERSVMLQEIHHRVKNNLQLITSMLRLEADRQGEAAAVLSIEKSMQRIFAMALVHDTLYQTEQLDSIDLVSYSESLLDAAKTSSPIEFALLAEGPVPVALDFAIPFGLLLNELISNTQRHAFPPGFGGRVDIGIQSAGGLRLSVSDNGIGMPESVSLEGPKSLGLSLVIVLVQQLHGTLALHRNPGTTWIISFPNRL